MNARERMLTILMVTVVGGGALIFGVVFWFVTPLRAYNASIAKLNEEVHEKQTEMEIFQMDRRKLVAARLKSLPPNPAEATNIYRQYLEHVMTYNGLAVEDISPSQASKMKFLPTVPGIKDVGHQMMTYTVRAKGDLKSLVGAMETMQSTPYEHRIRNLTVDRDLIRDSKETNPKLQINMVIETLLVANSDAKTGLPPGFDAKYAILDSLAAHGGVPGGWGMLGSLVAVKAAMPVPASRSYYNIAEKNIFAGKMKQTVTIARPKDPNETPKEPKDDVEPPVTQKGPDMLKYVYLTHTDPVQQTAYYRNRAVRAVKESKLVAKAQSGYDTFTIKDDLSDYVFLNAKVIRVDLRIVFFQKEDKLYAWHIGTTLEDALESWLDIDQRDAFDVELDKEYAAASAHTKEKSTKKTPTKGGSTKGGTKGGTKTTKGRGMQ